jgi:hypothetical protein
LPKHFNNQFPILVAGTRSLPLGDFSMPSPTAPTASLQKTLRRFRRNRRGSADAVLENITQNSARYIMTGQAQASSFTQSQFKTYVCGQIPALFTCGNVFVDVRSYPAFTSVTLPNQIDGAGNFINNMQYNPGAGSDMVVVRLFYQWPLFVTGLGFNIANLSGSKRLLIATAAFRNEPF